MKTIVIYAALVCSLFFSCKNATSPTAKNEEETKEEAKRNISKRDYSITKANAYSDLFLDSTAMEKYLSGKGVPDSVSRRLRSFYNTRNYSFAWFSTDGLTEQARAFWNLHDYVTTYDNDTSLRDRALQKKMEAFTTEEKLVPTASGDFLATELTLTEHFIRYILSNYEKGYVKRKEMERFVPYKKQEALSMADSLLNKKHKDNKYFENVHEPYRLLKEKLAAYYAIAKSGGWQAISTEKLIKPGSSSPTIAAIKKRLQLTGEFMGADSTQLFDDALAEAVKKFQNGCHRF